MVLNGSWENSANSKLPKKLAELEKEKSLISKKVSAPRAILP